MATPCILISDGSIQFGDCQLLKDINITINTGEFIGVFGPNGAGKSTLIKALLGLIPLASGRISIFGKSPGSENHQIGYMPQTQNIPQITNLSVRSLLMAVQQGKGWGLPFSCSSTRAEVNDVLRLVNADHLAEHPFHQLSGGEKQRFLLAQALLGKPDLLLLDEPLAALDPAYQRQLIEVIKKIKERTNVTILFIAHDINPLLGVMDRILYVAGGTAALGTVDEIITSEKLSELYHAEMNVIRLDGRLFIMNAESGSLEKTTCHNCS